jgi:excisionase family DNA binding protein
MPNCECNAAAERTGGPATAGSPATAGRRDRPRREEAALLDVERVAALLGCSARHVYRLADAGRMPRPVKLGHLVRWRRADVMFWITQGCPSCRQAGGARP